MTEQITTPDAPAPSAEDREALTDIIETAITDDGHREPRTAETRYVAHVAAGAALAARQPAPVGPDLAAIATTLGATTGWSRDDALAVLRELAARQPETTTEWGVRVGAGSVRPMRDEAHATHEAASLNAMFETPRDWLPVSREVTAWKEVSRG